MDLVHDRGSASSFSYLPHLLDIMAIFSLEMGQISSDQLKKAFAT